MALQELSMIQKLYNPRRPTFPGIQIMPKQIEVSCPCCSTVLTIDVLTSQIMRTADPREVDETGKIVLDEGRWEVAKDRVSDRKESADDKLDSALGKEQTRDKDMEDLFDKAKKKLQKPKDFDF